LPHETMIDLQEPARVGNFVGFGFEEKNFSDGATIKAFQISEITDKIAQELIRSKEVQFISPSVRSKSEFIDSEGRAIITAFIGSHNAGVNNPAYGMQKAQIKGICESDHGTCMQQLKNVQANKKSNSTIELHSCGMVSVHFSASDVSDCLSKKLTKGEKPTKQDIAICLSEEKNAGLDTISLENITRPELLLKKKDALGNKMTNNSNLKGKTYASTVIPMTKQANETDPLEDGTCPEGFVLGENGKCILTAAAYVAAQEEEKKNDEKDESAEGEEKPEEKDESADEEIKELKENQASLQKQLNDEIKKPLVASIVKQKSILGLVKQADLSKENTSLMGRKITDLQNLNSDYSAMLKNSGQEVEEHSTQVRFNMDESSHSASSEGNDNKYEFLDTIRERMN